MKLFIGNRLLAKNFERIELEPLKDKEGQTIVYKAGIDFDEDNWDCFLLPYDFDLIVKVT